MTDAIAAALTAVSAASCEDTVLAYGQRRHRMPLPRLSATHSSRCAISSAYPLPAS